MWCSRPFLTRPVRTPSVLARPVRTPSVLIRPVLIRPVLIHRNAHDVPRRNTQTLGLTRDSTQAQGSQLLKGGVFWCSQTTR